MPYKYSAKLEGETAKAVGRDLPISKKHSYEVCKFIRRRKLSRAKELMQEVIAGKKAVPYSRFNRDLGHKKSTQGPGRYPIKTCKEILKILESVEANAQFKGMNTSNLVIAHLSAQEASRPWRYGRQRRRKMKRTHIEIMVKEGKKKAEKPKKEVKKKEEKTEEKKEVKTKGSEKK